MVGVGDGIILRLWDALKRCVQKKVRLRQRCSGQQNVALIDGELIEVVLIDRNGHVGDAASRTRRTSVDGKRIIAGSGVTRVRVGRQRELLNCLQHVRVDRTAKIGVIVGDGNLEECGEVARSVSFDGAWS